jgi:hypothetical protein
MTQEGLGATPGLFYFCALHRNEDRGRKAEVKNPAEENDIKDKRVINDQKDAG